MRHLALIASCLLVSAPAAAQPAYGLPPAPPNSAERRAPMNALKSQGSVLVAAFAARVYRNAKGEQMPYRLFTPASLAPSRTYPLVVFLHGASGSGADNERQLQGGNLYGALVWALPGNQARHPAFVLAPQRLELALHAIRSEEPAQDAR